MWGAHFTCIDGASEGDGLARGLSGGRNTLITIVGAQPTAMWTVEVCMLLPLTRM